MSYAHRHFSNSAVSCAKQQQVARPTTSSTSTDTGFSLTRHSVTLPSIQPNSQPVGLGFTDMLLSRILQWHTTSNLSAAQLSPAHSSRATLSSLFSTRVV